MHMERPKRNSNRTRRLTTRISYDAETDFLTALTFGAAVELDLEQDAESPAEGFYVFRHAQSGPVIGFGVDGLSEFEPPGQENQLMPGFRFHVPTLALRNATPETVMLAARTTLDGESTPDVDYYRLGVEELGEDGNEAERAWRLNLASGDPRGHFGLALVLSEQGRTAEAYGHLREYVRVVPRDAWARILLAIAAESLGEIQEAGGHYKRALRLERETGSDTNAGDRLREFYVRNGAGRRP
jgi:tetratricopeptide (TPR) repeat protein